MAMPGYSINPFAPSISSEGGWCVACGQHHTVWAWCPRNTTPTPTIDWEWNKSSTSDATSVGETWTGDVEICPSCGGKYGCHTQTDCPGVPRRAPRWLEDARADSDTGWRCPNCGRGNAPYMKYCDCYLDRYHVIRS